MGKILYPVGTRVVVRAVKNHSPLYVVEYRKGKKFPYGLSDSPSGKPMVINDHKWFSVKGLKRYNPTQTKSEGQAVATATEAELRAAFTPKKDSSCACYTREEVDALVQAAFVEALEVVHEAARTAEEALDVAYGVEHTLVTFSKVTDRNMQNISKAFKANRHDDD